MSMCHWHVTFLGEKIKYNEKKRKDTKKDLIPRSSSFTIFTHKRALGWIPFTNKQYFLSFALFIHLQMTLLKKKHDKEKWRLKRAMPPFLSPPSSYSSPSWKTRDLVCSWDIPACPQLSMCSLLGGGDASQRNLTPSSRVYPRLRRCRHSHHHHHL